MNSNLFNALAICALPLLPGLQAEVEDSLFYLPDMETELFNTEKLDFGKRGTFDKSGLVVALTRIASDFDPEEKNGSVPNLLRSNALGIAGRINPDAKSFKTTCQDLERDGVAYGSSGTSKDRLVGKIYRGVRTLLKDKDNEDNKICAAYCVDIAVRLLPDHKDTWDLKKIQKTLKGEGIEIDWGPLQLKAQTVFRLFFTDSPNFRKHFVESKNLRKYVEPSGGSYLGPAMNGTDAEVILRFQRPPDCSRAHLATKCLLWDFTKEKGGAGRGMANIEASTDGKKWFVLLDGMTGKEWGRKDFSFDGELPGEILKGTHVYIRIRLHTENVQKAAVTQSLNLVAPKEDNKIRLRSLN